MSVVISVPLRVDLMSTMLSFESKSCPSCSLPLAWMLLFEKITGNIHFCHTPSPTSTIAFNNRFFFIVSISCLGCNTLEFVKVDQITVIDSLVFNFCKLENKKACKIVELPCDCVLHSAALRAFVALYFPLMQSMKISFEGVLHKPHFHMLTSHSLKNTFIVAG